MPKATSPTPRPRNLPLGMTIIHEDRDILVVNKPSGLLTMGTDSQKERTAYFMLTDYIRKGATKSKLRIFIVHRLDRDTSGVLLFAKNEEAKKYLQENWEGNQKQYLAIVHGHCREKSGTVESYLIESSALMVYATNDRVKGRLASTSYRVVKEVEGFSLLLVTPHTGRKNQIRVHLADLGHPIVGDKKYGVEKDGFKRLALHAASLTFTHPFRKELCTFSAPPPGWFGKLVGKIGTNWPQEKKSGSDIPVGGEITLVKSPLSTAIKKAPDKPAASARPTSKPLPPGNRPRAARPPRRRKQDG